MFAEKSRAWNLAGYSLEWGGEYEDNIPNGDFESNISGWFIASGPAALSSDDGGPTVTGTGAARVDSSGLGPIIVQSQYWLTPVDPGASSNSLPAGMAMATKRCFVFLPRVKACPK